MFAISRTEVNHDGCGRTAPDDMIWDNGSVINPRASSLQVIVDHIFGHVSLAKGAADLGKFRISFPELLILFEQSAGHRLTCEKVIRPISEHEDPQ